MVCCKQDVFFYLYFRAADNIFSDCLFLFKQRFISRCYFILARPRRVVSNVSDCRSRGREFDPGLWSHTFVEIDHEIISMAILLPSADSRRVVVSYK